MFLKSPKKRNNESIMKLFIENCPQRHANPKTNHSYVQANIKTLETV